MYSAMLPLFDMMMQAQNGEAMKAMSRHFGLDQDQMMRAMEALMPAFSTGLKRNATNPNTMMEFWQALADASRVQYFENLGKAFSPQGIEDGNNILGQLFGSKDLSRAIAKQAEQATGIGQEIYKRMMPGIASAMMGGLYKQSTGALGTGSGSTGNPFIDMWSQMMGQQKQPQSPAFENPYAKMMEQMFGSGNGKSASNAMADNPFLKMFEDMMKSGAPSQKSDPEPEHDSNPYDKLFGNMFDAGREIQKDYQKNMESIFDAYLAGMNNPKK
jgi:hypothetical protein